MSGFPNPVGFTRRAATASGGFALQNGVPVILSWTAPNDGNLHTYVIGGLKTVTSAETGGLVVVINGNTQISWLLNGNGVGTVGPITGITGTLLPGQTVTIQQTTALTAGASTVNAEIWSS